METTTHKKGWCPKKRRQQFLKTFKNSGWCPEKVDYSTYNLLKIQFTNERLPYFTLFYYSACNLCYKIIGVTRIIYYWEIFYYGYYSEIPLYLQENKVICSILSTHWRNFDMTDKNQKNYTPCWPKRAFIFRFKWKCMIIHSNNIFLLTAVLIETGAMPVPTKSQNPTACG